MSADSKRRLFLKGSMAVGTLSVAAGAGLLSPRDVLAAWPEAAFETKELSAALNELWGGSDLEESAEIEVKAPDIAENGAVVPVTVSTSMDGVESIAIAAPNNPSALVADFKLGEGALPYASTRIKMGETGDVVAVVNKGGKLYSARKQVKVTIGGCGG